MANFTIPTVRVSFASDEGDDIPKSQNDDAATPHTDDVTRPSEQEVSKAEESKEAEKDSGSNTDNGLLQVGDRPALTRYRGLRRRKSLDLQSLEFKFVQSIRRGDISSVEASMKMDPNLHCLEDIYGRSVLEHAVDSGSVEIMERLLEQCATIPKKQQAIERAMLYAIKENDLIMLDRLISILEDVKEQNVDAVKEDTKVVDPQTSSECVRKYLHPSCSVDLFNEDAEFSQNIKPIVLAAQLNRIEVIEMLYERTTPTIHPITKECSHPKECLNCHHQVNFIGRQSIEECRQALDVYKALASPAYLFHTGADDPLLEAFVISDLMQRRMLVDPAYHMEYSEISKQCKKFATDLLGLCRSVDEVQTLFGAPDGIERTHRTKYHEARFPRLLLAIHFNQKEFVAHPHCQQVMQTEWYDGLPDWVCQLKLHQLRFAAYTMLLFLFMPIIFILYLFRVQSMERFVKPAANKFILDMCSFIYFLAMLFLKVSFGMNPQRGRPLSVLDWFIFIWVVGQSLRYAKMSMRRRDRCNFQWINPENSNWLFFELLTLIFFWLQYVLLIGLWIHVSRSGDKWKRREQLSGNDIFLWSELFGAIASCLTVAHVYSYFKVSNTLGPLQVSLKKVMFDVGKIMIFFLVVLSSFAIGLSSLYSGYRGLSIIDPETHELIVQQETFTDIVSAYKRLFWDLFNYGNEDNVILVVGHTSSHHMFNVTGINGTTEMLSTHRLTEMIGYILYGAYHITVIVVLLNMLIAMMANSYNNIEANSDTEWKFARTRLFMNYFNEIGVLCPPFNLLPVRTLLAFLGKSFKRCKMFKRKATKPKHRDCKALLGRLRKRYWKMHFAKQRSELRKADITNGSPAEPGVNFSSTRKPAMVGFTMSDNNQNSSSGSDMGKAKCPVPLHDAAVTEPRLADGGVNKQKGVLKLDHDARSHSYDL